MKTKAFTLAELLLTMTIIGVIASYTIPTLMQNIQDVHLKTSWKKAYSDLSQNIGRLAIDYSGSFINVFTSDTAFRENFSTYLSVIKKCDSGTPTGNNGCWHNATEWYKLSGDIANLDYTGAARSILSNGILMVFDHASSLCTNTASPNNDTCGFIYVDVNGFRGPNMIGKDIFQIIVLKNGIIPAGTQNDVFYKSPTSASCDVNTFSTTRGWGCSADFLLNKSY